MMFRNAVNRDLPEKQLHLNVIHLFHNVIHIILYFSVTALNQIHILIAHRVSPKVFFKVYRQISIASVSGCCVRFIFKICQTVAGTSKMRHFHEFFCYSPQSNPHPHRVWPTNLG